MTQDDPSQLPRRRAIGHLVGGSLAAAIGLRPEPPLPAAPPDLEHLAAIRHGVAPVMVPDMSWLQRIDRPRRAVFDCAEIEEGVALHHVRVALAHYAEVEHTTDADWSVVLTIRHAAVPMLLNDAMWAKYPFLGRSTELKDPASGKRPARNPFLNANVRPDDRYGLIWPDGGLDTLVRRGVIVLACGMALRRLAGELARDTKRDRDAVHEEVLANLLPGVYVLPSGIFATLRAEEAGCRYFKSS
ncbi:MAG: hypothetical protein MUC69_09705 [Gemmatimonadales bacterium]|nr:hypothetical protein [Gemmatimonadales bacterium]